VNLIAGLLTRQTQLALHDRGSQLIGDRYALGEIEIATKHTFYAKVECHWDGDMFKECVEFYASAPWGAIELGILEGLCETLNKNISPSDRLSMVVSLSHGKVPYTNLAFDHDKVYGAEPDRVYVGTEEELRRIPTFDYDNDSSGWSPRDARLLTSKSTLFEVFNSAKPITLDEIRPKVEAIYSELVAQGAQFWKYSGAPKSLVMPTEVPEGVAKLFDKEGDAS
jgi:hypothetical protein